MKRKLLIGLAALVALIVLVLAAAAYSIFGANKPLEDGTEFGPVTAVIDVPYVPLFLVDAGDGKFVVIDGGVDQEFKALQTVLASRGATKDDILAVILTHGHSDHVGAAYGLTDKPLYVHEDDVAIAEGREVPGSPLSQLAGALPKGLKVTNPFKGGDVLTFGTAKIEVFHVPGHTAGSSAFLVNGTLLLGDAGHITRDDEIVPPPDIFTANPEQAIASIRELGKSIGAREDKPTWLVGGHSGGTQRIDALLKY